MTVTVCVPVWNGAAFVEETLDSVCSQTMDDIAVLISVDKSDDRSIDICREFAAIDPRLTVFAQAERLGWIGNVNWLMRRVDSEFACLLPHDDVIAPVYLECLMEELRSRPKAVLAHCDISTFGDRNDVLKGREVSGDRFERVLCFLTEITNAVAWRGVFRSEVLKKDCYLESANGAAADQVWLLRLVIAGHLTRVSDTLYRKRLHDQSVIAKTLTKDGVRNDNHWLDHCVSCHNIALAAGPWTDTQRQAISDACFARALLEARTSSMASLSNHIADYARRLSGLA